MGHQPWEESLNLDDDDDDGDLPSLLRPCKRRQHDFTISQSNPTQTLESYSQSQHHSLPLPSHPPTPPTAPRLIPGPAGAVQAAMNRRMSYKNQKTPPSSDLIPTQEYLRRVVENGDKQDDDFNHNAWACAVEFIRINGLGDGATLGTPLSSIKNGLINSYRVPQVVAMIKSCTPNGLGDMMVTLKDPSGTVGASIHRKVLLEEEFGRNISVGAVLILREVVVFSPSRTAHYLNITLGNMIKIISKDSEPPSKQNLSASVVKHPASVCVERPGIPHKASPLLRGRIEGILDEIRVSTDVRGTAQNDTQMRNRNGGPVSSSCSHGNQIAAVEREPFVARQDLVKEGIAEVAVREVGLGVQLGKEPNPWKQGDGGNLLGSIQLSTSTEAYLAGFSTNGNHKTAMTGFEKQSQPSSLRTTLPQWTDEQLDELFAMDSDN